MINHMETVDYMDFFLVLQGAIGSPLQSISVHKPMFITLSGSVHEVLIQLSPRLNNLMFFVFSPNI